MAKLDRLTDLVERAGHVDEPFDRLRACVEGPGLHDQRQTDLLARRRRLVWEVLEAHRCGWSTREDVQQQLRDILIRWHRLADA
ncbi:MAG TPA: hypothetical protein VG370_28280 [Chloroflexota bacterium]|jgi:hypothetical protein|nr:hypothetical protein [Chloroflexota bacterium]